MSQRAGLRRDLHMGSKRRSPPRRASADPEPGGVADAPAPPDGSGGWRWPGWVDALLIVLPPVLVSLHPIDSRDTGMHLAIGEWILDHGSLPTPDPFSFTAQGTHWVPHEWLVGVLFALVERAGGELGLSILVALSAALFAVVLRGMTRSLGVSTSAHLLWSTPVWIMLGWRMILRPHLFASMLPFLLWWILMRARERPRLIWTIPVVMVLWVNIHGSFLLGMGIIGLDLIVCGRWHPLPWRTRIPVTALALASILAQVHVYFGADLLAGVKHAFGLVGDPVFMELIKEWQSPFRNSPGTDRAHSFRATYIFQLSMVWIIFAAYGVLRRRPRLPLSYMLFVGVTLLLYFRHRRFVMLFAPAAIALLPFPALLLTRNAWRNVARIGAIAVSALFATLGYPIMGTEFRKPGLGWSSELPIDVIARGMQEFPDSLLPELEGIFCEYGFGATLMWLGKGELQPTMDGRNTVYGAELYLAHRAALDGPTPYREELLEKVGGVLISHPARKPARMELYQRLKNDPRWRWEVTTPEPDEPYLFLLKHPR